MYGQRELVHLFVSFLEADSGRTYRLRNTLCQSSISFRLISSTHSFNAPPVRSPCKNDTASYRHVTSWSVRDPIKPLNLLIASRPIGISYQPDSSKRDTQRFQEYPHPSTWSPNTAGSVERLRRCNTTFCYTEPDRAPVDDGNEVSCREQDVDGGDPLFGTLSHAP